MDSQLPQPQINADGHIELRRTPPVQATEKAAVIPAPEVPAPTVAEQPIDLSVDKTPIQEELHDTAPMPAELMPPTAETSVSPLGAQTEPVSPVTTETPTTGIQPALNTSPVAQPAEAVPPKHLSVAEPSTQEQSLNQLESWFGDASEKNGSSRIDSAEPTTK